MKKFYSTLGLIISCLFSTAQVWAPVGSGVNSSVDAFNIYQGKLVAGGRYSPMTTWDGSAWTDLTSGVNPTATAIFVEGNDLYSGTQFTGGDAFKVISHYDGTNWSIVGGSTAAYLNINWNTNNHWYDIFKYNSNLYGVYDNGLFRYDSSVPEFSSVGDQLTDLGVAATSLRFAGIVNNIAYFSGMTNSDQQVITWNNSNWDTLDLTAYPLRGILGVEAVNNELFIAGGFQDINGTIFGMLKWDGTTLSTVLGYGAGIPRINLLFSTTNHLYATYFDTVDHIGVWNGTSFENLGGEITSVVNAVSEHAGIAYAGGFFSTFDGVTANNIAQSAITVSVKEIGNENQFSFYPNPANEKIELSPSTVARKVDILNSMGQSIDNQTLQAGQTKISIAHLLPGIYTIRLVNDNKVQSSRVLKY
ncbi:MAG: T9SS type A sorting domain-containing protein [Bacteroidetes bacterium]|nr:MAG: T9SS type A sorting domain-containing protein [Bacteroidota bacterium]